jgi:cell division protein ZapE
MLERVYEESIKEHGYSNDAAQLKLLNLLSKYQEKIEKNDVVSKLRKALGMAKTQKQGVYIHGKVGRGKTFIANLFFNGLNTERKYRQHFHQFMLDCHHKINELNQTQSASDDALHNVAQDIIKKYQTLYLDEFQINNIVDAMLLSRLFTMLIKAGMYIFITSNSKPSEIYSDGLKREYILPFIDFIQEHLDIYYLDNPKDYRKEKLKGHENLFIQPFQDPKNQSYLNMIIDDLLSDGKFGQIQIQVTENRFIKVTNSCDKVGKFTFTEICAGNFGAGDYIALSKHFSVIIITHIPQLKAENHNEALRFITLIDCMYDSKTLGVFSAEVPVENLYLGETHRNEFNRTISRIYEMQSENYINLT